jgi:SAM-dependent methyltransferase
MAFGAHSGMVWHFTYTRLRTHRRLATLKETIRRAELEIVRRHLSPPLRILELGGGNGLQAKTLQSWGNDVTSLDVQAEEGAQHFPVSLYDGRTLPFPPATFDVVFSSNVLEHVTDLSGLLTEAKRVLRPAGLMIHMLPTPSWRFWTMITYYFAVGPALLSRRSKKGGPPSSNVRKKRTLFRRLAGLVFPGAHGVFPSAISELYYYSARSWLKVFRANGLTVIEMGPCGIFYTGHKILRFLGVSARQRMARALGSGSNYYVLRVNAT